MSLGTRNPELGTRQGSHFDDRREDDPIHNPKKKGRFDSGPCDDQLVAGEGFEPSTFGL